MTISDRTVINDSLTRETPFTVVKPDGSLGEVTRALLKEHLLTIFIDETKAMEICCTPTHLPELVVGRLISEGLFADTDGIDVIDICEQGLNAKVFTKQGGSPFVSSPQLRTRDTAFISSCCTDNRQFVERRDDLSVSPGQKYKTMGLPPAAEVNRKTKASVSGSDIFAVTEFANKDMKLHKETSGTHSCYLYHKSSVIFSCEDIGRHNALDKAIGKIYLERLDPGECIVYTTGRTPLDMIRKAVRAGLCALVSKSVPTYEAAMLAKEYGLLLCSRSWPDSYETV